MAKTAVQRILMVRSGATEWDDSARVQGSTDLPMSASGRSQIASEVDQLGQPRLSAVVCAPDEASVATARVLADAAGVRVVVVPDLHEISLGLWEGILRSELDGRFCRAGRQWGDDPCCVTPPEGESIDAFAARLVPALKKAVARAARRGPGASLGAGGEAMEAVGVGVVLRPVGDAVVRCVLAGRPSTEMCSVIEARPQAQWFEIATEQPWTLRTGPRRPAPASAA